MKIVIDIPEESYKLLKDEGVDWLGAEHILDAVANGTPLPKRHGDLIDREELINKYAGWYNLVTDKSIKAVSVSELYQIEPIIPADGDDAESEDKK